MVVRGGVQGVGYRAFVEHEASRHGVEGWVRNRRDGSVEAVFAGAQEMEVESLRPAGAGPMPPASMLWISERAARTSSGYARRAMCSRCHRQGRVGGAQNTSPGAASTGVGPGCTLSLIQSIDARGIGPARAARDDGDNFLRAKEHGLDAAVAVDSAPSLRRRARRLMLDKGAVTDALHAAAHDHMTLWSAVLMSVARGTVLPRAARDMTVRPVMSHLKQKEKIFTV